MSAGRPLGTRAAGRKSCFTDCEEAVFADAHGLRDGRGDGPHFPQAMTPVSKPKIVAFSMAPVPLGWMMYCK